MRRAIGYLYKGHLLILRYHPADIVWTGYITANTTVIVTNVGPR